LNAAEFAVSSYGASVGASTHLVFIPDGFGTGALYYDPTGGALDDAALIAVGLPEGFLPTDILVGP
jgi:hypothetical protein